MGAFTMALDKNDPKKIERKQQPFEYDLLPEDIERWEKMKKLALNDPPLVPL
jgi:hypothetical protein